MSLNVIKGIQERALFALLYAPEGVGKSTFCAGAPNALFIDLEGGTALIDVARVSDISTTAGLLSTLDELATSKHGFETVVIDTVSACEEMIWAEIAERNGKSSIGLIPYGKGYEEARDVFLRILSKLERIRDRGIAVWLLGHTDLKLYNDPQGYDHDTYAVRLHKHIYPKVYSHVDIVAFANYEMVAIDDPQSSRPKAAATGKRKLYLQKSRGYDAKSRYALPKTLDLNYAVFTAALTAAKSDTVGNLIEEVKSTLEALPASPKKDELNAKVSKASAGKDVAQLQRLLAFLKNESKNNKEKK